MIEPLLVALATYNERENLPSLVAEIHRQLPRADILVVDDNSPDATGEWCDEFAASQNWFSVVHRPSKKGLGTAAWLIFRAAIEQEYAAVITLDADWSHPPDALPRMAAAAAEADVVVGSRYCRGGRIVGWRWRRRVASRFLNWLTLLASGVPVRDASTACRLYRTELLRRLDFNSLREPGYAYLEEVLARLHRHGARIVEIPIEFTDRRHGRSKVGMSEVTGKLRIVAQLALQVASARFRKNRS